MSTAAPSSASTTNLAPAPAPSATPSQPLPPGFVSVLCPPGFTASSLKEFAAKRPLYARLIYRPL